MNFHAPDEHGGSLFFPEQFELKVELGTIRLHVFLDSGFFNTNSDVPVLNHNHASYEVQFVHKGTVVLCTEYGDHAIRAGSFCVIPPGLYHSQKRTEPGEDVHKSCFTFRYDVLSLPKPDYPAGETNELLYALANVPFFIADGNRETDALLDMAKQEFHCRPIGYFAKLQSLFAQLILVVIRSSPRIQSAPRRGLSLQPTADSRLGIIECFFSEHFSRPLRENDLARRLYVSQRQLNRILHDLYGMSFRHKLLSTRMKVAMDLLKNTELSVKDIATNVGYPFAENFHAHFKKHTTMTPSSFRNSSRSNP
ncbi:helix-turn-helix domain-containing protein [Paenibacillus hemerocallicola]|uniref:Helix-turn-helix domain-containing protein n=1 Tax=Paenibacillus hemerocallicola TaxID=1172614 RepID=A0A5C4T1Z9_9BACL|nr:AraC family transcriptional regulator [Paenibacillus hemerocallicola]TNJ63092.1 helix-turn-helix domain-containing protein [Paenibacillus hemerocallicola]